MTVDEADDPETSSIAEHKATYTVKLATEPTPEVTVTVTGHAGTDLTLDKGVTDVRGGEVERSADGDG